MNYLDAHHIMYILGMAMIPSVLNVELYSFAYKGFRGRVGKMHGKFGIFLINPKFCMYLFILLMTCVFFKLYIYLSNFNKYMSINICYLISYV